MIGDNCGRGIVFGTLIHFRRVGIRGRRTNIDSLRKLDTGHYRSGEKFRAVQKTEPLAPNLSN